LNVPLARQHHFALALFDYGQQRPVILRSHFMLVVVSRGPGLMQIGRVQVKQCLLPILLALAAARGDKTTAQLAAQFGVHGNQVAAWKKQLLDGVEELFVDGRRRKSDEASADEQELYEQIGRLKMEVEWLKKKRSELG
jgi:transposase